MALTDKNIVITPNVGQSSDPQIAFSGASSTLGAQTITARVYPTSNGTISFEGSAGQLFSITNSLTGTIFAVNDVSGIPSIEVLDTGAVKVAQYNGRVLVGNVTDNGVDKVQVSGRVSAPTFVGDLIGTADLALLAVSKTAGLANQILYQTAPNTTGFVTAPTYTGTYLQWNGTSFSWGSAGGLIISNTEPASSNEGDQWLNTKTSVILVKYEGNWVEF